MIRVLLVDDDALVRAALALMLGGQPDLEVVGEAGDGARAVEMVRHLQPDVVLMDIRMPVLNGIEATRVLQQLARAPRVVVLTTFDADDHVVQAVVAGADGFLLKDTPPAGIVDAVRKVAAGEAMLSASATRSLLARVRTDATHDRTEQARRRLEALTERELEVAVCVGQGLSNADTARDLHLSVPTVKAHVSRVFAKLECTNRVQVAMCVHDAGLV